MLKAGFFLALALSSSNSAPSFDFEKCLSNLASFARLSHRFPHVENFSLRKVEAEILLASDSRGVGLRTGLVKKSGSVRSIQASKQVAPLIGFERGPLGCLKYFFNPLMKRNLLQATICRSSVRFPILGENCSQCVLIVISYRIPRLLCILISNAI